MLVPAMMLEYVQMLQAHANYWHSEVFADFVLATACVDDGDQWGKARRTLGLNDDDDDDEDHNVGNDDGKQKQKQERREK